MIKPNQIEESWHDSDGYWIVLKMGLCDLENHQCHTIVEDTRSAALSHIAVLCNCKDCAANPRLSQGDTGGSK